MTGIPAVELILGTTGRGQHPEEESQAYKELHFKNCDGDKTGVG